MYLFVSSGSSIAGKPSPEAIREQNELDGHRNRILISPLFTEDELDTAPGNIPVVNPTTPVVNPTTPTVQPINPPAETTTPTPVTSGGQWCIASPTASPTALQVALDYACGYGGADCSALQPGASCFDPNNLRDHASYAFNDYYQKNPAPTSCVFGGTAQLTNTDPSNGNCHYASSSKSTSMTPPAPVIPAPVIPTPTTTTPTITTPATTIPGGNTVYGAAEPTGLPSSATSISCSFVLFFVVSSLLGSLLAADCLQTYAK